MGLAETALGRIDDAVADHLRAVSLRERIAPDSPACANSYNNLANAYTEQGDLRQALAHYSRAASIAERTAPGSLDCAECYQNVGNVHFDRGDLGSPCQYERALAIWERRHPWGGLLVANIASVHKRGIPTGSRGANRVPPCPSERTTVHTLQRPSGLGRADRLGRPVRSAGAGIASGGQRPCRSACAAIHRLWSALTIGHATFQRIGEGAPRSSIRACGKQPRLPR